MANELVQEQENLTVWETQRPRADEDEHQRAAMFPDDQATAFRGRWHDIQAGFVDEPRDAVRKADELVGEVIQRLADSFRNECKNIESNWQEGRDVSTEDLRRALRRYRSFFDRLLSA
jgi:hypothetical protein